MFSCNNDDSQEDSKFAPPSFVRGTWSTKIMDENGNPNLSYTFTSNNIIENTVWDYLETGKKSTNFKEEFNSDIYFVTEETGKNYYKVRVDGENLGNTNYLLRGFKYEQFCDCIVIVEGPGLFQIGLYKE